jgi:predicted phage terminase large subunit-like protein
MSLPSATTELRPLGREFAPVGFEDEPEDWKPFPGPQEEFLSLTCREALYGGAAGGGKSDALLVDAIRYVGCGYGRAYQGLLLRRTFPELEKNLIVRSHELYPRLDGEYNEQKRTWTFPGGERVLFGYLEKERDVLQYQGSPFQFVGFDELTHFSLAQYLYLFSRMRSTRGVPLRMRGATNPGGPGHDWVFARFGPWLDPRYQLEGLDPRIGEDGEPAPPARPGQVLYFVREKRGVERLGSKGELKALGRCFVPAKLKDNPALAGGDYERMLEELDPVTLARLRDGNWTIKPGKGLYFKRGWFDFIDALPAGIRWVRAWDLASTPEPGPGESGDPDWTAGVKMGRTPEGRYVIADIVRLRGRPGDVRAAIRATAELDGRACRISIPQDPGQAGVDQVATYAELLKGFTFSFRRPTANKIVRAGPLSAQASARNVTLVRGDWNAPFLEEAESFPDENEQEHDDQIDAASDAFAEVLGATPPKLPPASLSAQLPKRRC